MKRIAVAAGAAALLAVSGVTAAHATSGSTPGTTHKVSVGNCTTEGEFASCSVAGDISHPHSIAIQVWATPSQKITVTWGNLCSAGLTSGDRNGQFTVTAGVRHKATRPIPLAAGHSGKCTPDVLVSLGSSGHLHAVLSGKH